MLPVRVVDTQHADELYARSHVFLTCRKTLLHLRRTKVMFLMRGLPGSGKSTLVKTIEGLYSSSLAICSADNFFLDENGVYNFNPSKIQDAHRTCQEKAEEAMKNNTLAVIIDNTNIRHDECRTYFQKAARYGYLVVIVEPRTSWKRDADILAQKNSHKVPKEVIEARLKLYHPIIPFYFGLFLNEEDSNEILLLGQELFLKSLKHFPKLREDLEKVARKQKIPVEFFLSRKNMKNPSTLLHCTMKFFGRPDDTVRKDFENYAGNRIVSHSLGKHFTGKIVGFAITPRTFGARLSFEDENVAKLWAQNDEEPFSDGKKPEKKDGARSARGKKKVTASKRRTRESSEDSDESDQTKSTSLIDQDNDLVDEISKMSIEPEKVSFFHPTFGFLSRAHLTCGVAPDVSASQTGIDLIHLIRQESEVLRNNVQIETFEAEKVAFRYFNDGQCMIYLREPIPIDSIFTGYFV